MHMWKKYSIVIAVLIQLMIVYSCKDSGTQPAPQIFSTSSTDVIVVKGAATQITLSGGTTPYSIKIQPNNAKATASLASTTLTITGVDTGKTFIILNDNKTPIPDSVNIKITVTGTTPTVTVSFSGKIQSIFTNNCTFCHGSSGGLNLTAGVSYNNLVNVSAQSSCTSLKRVLPNDADNSVLYRKITGSACGNRMPQGGTLTQANIDSIRVWIDQGANNN
jgi:hypothetical protein